MQMSSPDQHPRGPHPLLACASAALLSDAKAELKAARLPLRHVSLVAMVAAFPVSVMPCRRSRCGCSAIASLSGIWKLQLCTAWNLDWRGDNIGDSGTCMRFYTLSHHMM